MPQAAYLGADLGLGVEPGAGDLGGAGDGLEGDGLAGEMIEAFIASGCPRAAESTRGNYRSRLLRLRALVLGPDLSSGDRQRLAGSHAQAPYTGAQLGQLWESAGAQPTPALRTGLKTLMALGLGCGLDTPEAHLVRARHVHQDPGTGATLVSVPGDRARITVCRYAWERILLEAATALDPDCFLVRPGAQTRGKNTVANFLARAHTPPGSLRLSMGRARATWIVELVDANVPLTTLIAAAGVDTLHALSRLMPYFAPTDPGTARLLLRGRE